MIKRKEKFATPNFTFWLTEHTQPNIVDYDIIFGGHKVAPPATKDDLKKLSKFILDFIYAHE